MMKLSYYKCPDYSQRIDTLITEIITNITEYISVMYFSIIS